MSATSLVRSIPLNHLALAPTNVRKTPASTAEDAELKGGIQSCGVLQNLLVHPSPDEPDMFLVHAGGRRLKALQELAGAGTIAADYPVPCLVASSDDALETSLMENLARAAMHPADEFAAMARLIDDGATIDQVAVRFGVSERHVRQRLRLGKLAPKLLDQFRAGEITLGIVTAFTLGTDHAAQLAVWCQVKNQYHLSAYTVRRLLTEKAIAIDSDLGAFVGIAVYEAAGGYVTRDLFSEDDDGFMDDAALVQRLAIEKLEAKAAELRSAWAWATAVLDPDYGFTAQYGRVQPRPAELTPAVAQELEAIEQRLQKIEEMPEDAWTDDLGIEAARLSERHDEIIEDNDAEAIYASEDRAIAGCIVTVGEEGEFRIYEGLIDRALHPNNATRVRDGDDANGDEFHPVARQNGGTPPAPSHEQTMRKECGFSQGLIDDLKAHRQQITRAHLAGDFTVAFDLALYTLCVDLLAFRSGGIPLSLRASFSHPRSSLNDLADTPADQLLDAQEEALDKAWLSLPPTQRFAALAALPPEAKQRLFAWCVAATLEPQLGFEEDADVSLECAGERLAIPFADYWRPTAANYWGRVKKAHALNVAATVLGPRWAKDHGDDKKATLAAALEIAFDPSKNGTAIGLDQAARDAAVAWLPPGMPYAGIVINGGDVNTDTDDDVRAEPGDDQASSVCDQADTENPSDLPAFLTDDDPPAARLNGISPR